MRKSTLTGSCLCGNISYEYNGELGPASYCHCTDCRKVTGSAFIVSVRLDIKFFKITSESKTKSFTKMADSGNSITRAFCPDCGSPIFTTSEKATGYIWVRAGTVDNPELIKPVHQYWTDSKVDWAEIPEGITSFNKGR